MELFVFSLHVSILLVRVILGLPGGQMVPPAVLRPSRALPDTVSLPNKHQLISEL